MIAERPTLHCYCCGEPYVAGQFRCCATPNGMSSQRWLSLACPMAPDGCGKCAKHCACPNKAERIGEGPLAKFGRQFLENPQLFVANVSRVP